MRGNQLFDMYARLVQRIMVLLILTLEILMGLNSKQGDMTADFLHANMLEGENVSVNIFKGFEHY